MMSEVMRSPLVATTSCTWRGGTTQPVTNIARRTGISVSNGKASRVAAASKTRIAGSTTGGEPDARHGIGDAIDRAEPPQGAQQRASLSVDIVHGSEQVDVSRRPPGRRNPRSCVGGRHELDRPYLRSHVRDEGHDRRGGTVKCSSGPEPLLTGRRTDDRAKGWGGSLPVNDIRG